MTGTVYLVGSGPGDPEILTVKARRLIENADVVLHDKLLGRALLESIVDLRDAAGIEPPAIAVIGDVVGSRERVEVFLENGCESGIAE